jgi:hypothetical protein
METKMAPGRIQPQIKSSCPSSTHWNFKEEEKDQVLSTEDDLLTPASTQSTQKMTGKEEMCEFFTIVYSFMSNLVPNNQISM